MSAGHRPQWAPSRGQQSVSHLSHQTHKTGLTSHTKLKFRQPASAAGPSAERRDLKRELEQAELEAKNKRRAIQGLPTQQQEDGEVTEEDEVTRLRKEALRKAIELDRDESEDEDDQAESSIADEAKSIEESSDSDSDSNEDEGSEEDETAALLAELEKIKAERAAQRAQAEQEQDAAAQATREEEIAYGNPLLNLENILHPSSSSSTSKGGAETLNFGVKRRWDDDVIFKNQASVSQSSKSAGFVNDLTRSEFHKKFMNRYIK